MEDTILFQTKFWEIKLSENQAYLGRCVILLKRNCGELSMLNSEEWGDYIIIVKRLEFAFKKAFDATMFNWTCLMNNAFQEKNPKPRVHWHFRPRYNHNVNFAGEKFEDLEFAHHYSSERHKIVQKLVLEEIAKEVKKYL